MYQPSFRDAQALEPAEQIVSTPEAIPLPWLEPVQRKSLSALVADPLTGPILLLAAAFAIRCAWFGNPVIQIDEQFYLLVGDRMLHGALPFVDVWDRKPIGLFLIYGAIRLLGGTGIIQYQVVATLFAWATALIITRIARSIASARAAWLAGGVYLLWLNFFTGEGGQSPVFYNLFVAGAGLLTMRAMARDATPRRIFRLGLAAMALAGVAMQVKYTALFEGIFFGLALLWAIARATGRVTPVLGAGMAWVALALLPSALVLSYYASVGHADAFLYANFLSVMERGSAGMPELLQRLGIMALLLSPLFGALALSERAGLWRTHDRAAHHFILAWLGAAIGGLLAFGTYYDHYALPLLVSLCAAAAPAFDYVRRDARIGLRLAGLLVAIGLVGIGVNHHLLVKRKGDAAYISQLAQAIEANRHGGSLYIYEGEPILYLLTGAPAPTRFMFPNHLGEAIEAPAVGVDPTAELRRIVATRPQVIVDAALQPVFDTPERRAGRNLFINDATRAVLDAALAKGYRLAAQFKVNKLYRRVWVLRPGPRPLSV
jgi:hypothetical protein